MTTETRWPIEPDVERRLLAPVADPDLDDYFGASHHAELRALARAARSQRGGEGVLILPGLMGSTLGRLRGNGRRDVKWFDPVEIALGGLVQLALPSTRRIEPLGVLLFAYLRLKLSLRAAGFDAAFHPYDWRRSVAAAGRLLGERLEAGRGRKVHLVAHSMGGLVARAVLAHPGAARIDRIVQLGTPNRGAFAAVKALRGTYPLVRRLAMLDLAHDARELARDVFTTLPGLLELLPDPADCDAFDPFRAGDWPRGPRPRAQVLAEARQAVLDLPSPDDRFALVAGDGRETLTGLRRRDGRLEFRRSVEGDGTVPLRLARLDGLPTWISGAAHGALPGDDAVTRAVIELLRQGDTSILPREPASTVRKRARWVAEEEPDTRADKIFWDDLAVEERRDFLGEFVLGPQEEVRGQGQARSPVELTLEAGSITEASAEAIVLGLFSNVEPAGAALAVDAALGGAIGDLAHRRALHAAAGEVFLLPAARGGLRARYVAFAGLGGFGRYGPDVQSLAAANVVRTLSLAGVRDIAWVLWGTASGVAPGQAARSQLSGLLAALAELEPRHRPRRVTLLSRSLRRLGAARSAMELLLRTDPRSALVSLARTPARAPRKSRPVASADGAASYLFVQESGGELHAALLGPTPKGTALAATRRLDERLLDQHLERLAEGLSADDVPGFGDRLGELLLPAATRMALATLREAPLVVVHDSAASRWPWETLALEGWAPAAGAGLSRRYAANGMSVAKWREERRLTTRLEVLLVANPTEDLPGADEESRRVRKALDRDDARVTVLRGGEATRARLLEEFRSGAYDVLHFAGHAFFDTSSPASSGVLCAGGRVLSGSDLASLDALPALVFFNACESGRVRQMGRVSRALARGTGLAEAFLRGGVANFIGTWWPVADVAASRFAVNLYQRLTQGETIGSALQAARTAVRRLRSADWANYLHYGSFDFALKKPGRRRPPVRLRRWE